MSESFHLLTKISPSGQLRIRHSPDNDGEVVEAVLETGILEAFSRTVADGLFHLVTIDRSHELPPILRHWQEFGRHFIGSVCAMNDLEESQSCQSLSLPLEWLEIFHNNLPPQRGLEYFDMSALHRIWDELKTHFDQRLHSYRGSLQDLLKSLNAPSHLVGRVYFHLAENKRDPDKPFAFMASYTTKLNRQAKAQHLPLGKAVQEFAASEQKEALLTLLKPIQNAAEKVPWVKQLADSGAIFHPQAWASAEAFRFLKSVPELESQGIIVRIPDWWKSQKKTMQAELHITLGDKTPGGLGVRALLDFKVELSLGDERLTEAELQELLRYTEGLVLFRGRWIEIDHHRLQDVLDNWRKLKKKASDEGLSFFESLRLLAGIDGLGSKALITGEVLTATRVIAGSWLKQTLESLRSPLQTQRAHPGKALKATLREYQERGVHWLWLMNQMRLGACLADDMGLGKTIQVLSLLLIKQQEQPGHRSLLVVPTSLISNWQNEVTRFAPSLRLKILHGINKNIDSKDALKDPTYDLAITSYGMTLRIDAIQNENWDLLILDEAQAIKNPAARQTRAIKKLQAHHRLALTGTPVENGVGDLWSIFDFLAPGLLGGPTEFKKYLQRADSEGRSPYAGIRKLVQPYILRRLKTDKSIISDLPDKTEVTSFCSLSKTQAALYQEAVEDLKSQLKLSEEGIQRRGIVLSFLMRFKQICNHPSQWTQDGLYRADDSGKLTRLKEICSDIVAQQEKLLIFTQFREMTAPLASFLAEIFGEPGFILHGGTSVKSRKDMMERFQTEDGPPFFVLSLKAGGTGLNLTAASHVIHFDRWWNPAVENQATDRAFRIGQKKNVLVHKFVCKGTLEEQIDRLIKSKQTLSEEVLEGGETSFLTEMTNEELLAMVHLDLNAAVEENN